MRRCERLKRLGRRTQNAHRKDPDRRKEKRQSNESRSWKSLSPRRRHQKEQRSGGTRSPSSSGLSSSPMRSSGCSDAKLQDFSPFVVWSVHKLYEYARNYCTYPLEEKLSTYHAIVAKDIEKCAKWSQAQRQCYTLHAFNALYVTHFYPP